ncbi:MAG: hypothetical protein H6704_03905 [Myxococcales bacterium]|nr:hypothetical protein [Myxococcales bacterium]
MNKVVQITSAVFLAVVFIPMCSTTYIGPDEIGVRKAVFGGIDDEDFEQGRHLDLPFLHSFYRLPRQVQFLEFKRFPVRNNQNNQFFVDISILYEIVEGGAHKIGQEGLINTWHAKVKSVCEGFLRVHLAQLDNESILDSDERIQVALSSIEPLNKQLGQYHVRVRDDGVVIRAIRFERSYEGRLQAQQLLAVQARLDEAKEKESEARMQTDTVKKGIDKDVAVEEQEWNKKIADLRQEWEVKIAEVRAEVERYQRRVRAEADAHFEQATAEGERAVAEARALGERLKTDALNTRAGRTYSAILAARNFKLGNIRLNSSDPNFLQRFASMGVWRNFFLPDER